MRRLINNQAGDTIIEVMLAIAVIGMVLGASYATATRALRTGRFAQEQTEALKLAESQIEKLKYIASTNRAPRSSNDVFDPDAGKTSFCIDDGSTGTVRKILTTDTNYAAFCNNISQLYDQVVQFTPATNLFTSTISWDGPTGIRGKMEVSYRLYR